MKSFTSSFFKPTNLHKMPMGMLWEYKKEDDESVWYIQVSENINNPHWITIDRFFGQAFKGRIKSTKFMDMCMKMYNNSNYKVYFKIIG